MLASGSPSIWRSIRNFSGSVPSTGRTFWATGLYFLLAYTSATGGRENRVLLQGDGRVEFGKEVVDVIENIGCMLSGRVESPVIWKAGCTAEQSDKMVSLYCSKFVQAERYALFT